MHHCIVTPDFIGPIKNGGIGTHCYWLARALVASGRAVTVLFTGPVQVEDAPHWQKHYADLGIEFVPFLEVWQRKYPVRTFPLQERSLNIYHYLCRRSFDAIHFQDWQGNGLHTVRARHVLGEFLATSLTVTLHSNTRWIAEGNGRWYGEPLADAMTAWAEAYVAQHVDFVFSPSQHMLDWVRQAGWKLAGSADVIPYTLGAVSTAAPIEAEPGVLAFFGRLETRKGLEVFLRALGLLSESDRQKVRKVYFVGKSGRTALGEGANLVETEMRKLGLPFELKASLDSAGAVNFLKKVRASVFAPSLSDNYPFSILEAGIAGLPVFASRVGGIPEILNASNLYAPMPRDLRDTLRAVLNGESRGLSLLYEPEAAAEGWRQAMVRSEERAAERAQRPSQLSIALPRISICVPYFNYGAYLPKLLESLRRSTYRNFEIIVVDDGSTDERSRQIFDELKSAPSEGLELIFNRHGNSGVGATRNFAASMATGDLLVFMDADNLAKPEMLATFVAAMARSQADIVTCHFDAFRQDDEPSGEQHIHHVYAPAGPAVEVGWSENVFGDANFCIRREIFDALGGFGTERDSSWEDWEFLARAALAEYSIEVVPRSLFWYRYTDEGFSRNTSPYKNQRRVLRAYEQAVGGAAAASINVMRQVALRSDGAVATPAGRIAGQIADRIYTKLGSPKGKLAVRAEAFFKKILR
ncbi:glycosyltransferase (plasmid) [Ensifer sp. PDNC004]|uniref:glycosyltransferase n=1 Tax=Ensifer sp. PDNC004 TaxID=2811423 RepID=UPI00196498D3|nr:glycosyltransferase [Ensifer sp. PDNC004]QRY65482.1 glycosyltransferase [Ensifer sp. PDNC004]